MFWLLDSRFISRNMGCLHVVMQFSISKDKTTTCISGHLKIVMSHQ